MNWNVGPFLIKDTNTEGKTTPFGNCVVEIEHALGWGDKGKRKFVYSLTKEEIYKRLVFTKGLNPVTNAQERWVSSDVRLDDLDWEAWHDWLIGDGIGQHEFKEVIDILTYKDPETEQWVTFDKPHLPYEWNAAFKHMTTHGVPGRDFKFMIRSKNFDPASSASTRPWIAGPEPTGAQPFMIRSPPDPTDTMEFSKCTVQILHLKPWKRGKEICTVDDICSMRASGQYRLSDLSWNSWRILVGVQHDLRDDEILQYEDPTSTGSYKTINNPVIGESEWRAAFKDMALYGVRDHIFRFLIRPKTDLTSRAPPDDPKAPKPKQVGLTGKPLLIRSLSSSTDYLEFQNCEITITHSGVEWTSGLLKIQVQQIGSKKWRDSKTHMQLADFDWQVWKRWLFGDYRFNPKTERLLYYLNGWKWTDNPESESEWRRIFQAMVEDVKHGTTFQFLIRRDARSTHTPLLSGFGGLSNTANAQKRGADLLEQDGVVDRKRRRLGHSAIPPTPASAPNVVVNDIEQSRDDLGRDSGQSRIMVQNYGKTGDMRELSNCAVRIKHQQENTDSQIRWLWQFGSRPYRRTTRFPMRFGADINDCRWEMFLDNMDFDPASQILHYRDPKLKLIPIEDPYHGYQDALQLMARQGIAEYYFNFVIKNREPGMNSSPNLTASSTHDSRPSAPGAGGGDRGGPFASAPRGTPAASGSNDRPSLMVKDTSKKNTPSEIEFSNCVIQMSTLHEDHLSREKLMDYFVPSEWSLIGKPPLQIDHLDFQKWLHWLTAPAQCGFDLTQIRLRYLGVEEGFEKWFSVNNLRSELEWKWILKSMAANGVRRHTFTFSHEPIATAKATTGAQEESGTVSNRLNGPQLLVQDADSEQRTQNFADCIIHMGHETEAGHPREEIFVRQLGTQEWFNDNRHMALEDLDWKLWKNYLKDHNFNADMQELLYMDNQMWRPVLRIDSEAEWRKAFISMAQNRVPGTTFRFRIQKSTSSPFGPAIGSKRKAYTENSQGPKRQRPENDGRDHGQDNSGGKTPPPEKVDDADRDDKPSLADEEEDFEDDDDDLELEFEETPKEKAARIMEQEYARLAENQLLEQFDEDTWRKCCEFFHMDPKATQPEVSVRLKEIHRPLLAYQAYAIFWMLQKERSPGKHSIGGGFLADEQGLGKTAEALGLCIVDRILQVAKNQVDSDRRSKDPTRNRLHLPANSNGEECPSERDANKTKDITKYPFSICCPCRKTGPSAKLVPKMGPILVIAPAQLLNVWEQEFDKMFYSPKNKTKRDHTIADRNPLRMRLIVRHESKTIEAEKVRNLLKHDTKKEHPPKNEQSSIIVVTSSESYNAHVLQFWGKNEQDTNHKMPRKAPIKFASYYNTWTDTVAWGRIIRDECHLQKGMFTHNLDIIRHLRTKRDAYMWALSGTPFEVSPEDLEGYIGVLRKDAWGKTSHKELKDAQESEFQELIKEHGTMVKNGIVDLDKFDRYIEKLSTILRALMIRRKTVSKWFEKEIVKLPKPVHCDWHDTKMNEDPRYKRDLGLLLKQIHNDLNAATEPSQDANDQLDDQNEDFRGTKATATRIRRICATVPAVARIRAAGGPQWELTVAEANETGNQWFNEGVASPYTRYLPDMVHSSKKFAEIERLVLKDLGKKEKVVIMSEIPAVSFIVHLWLNFRKKGSSVFIHSKTKNKDRWSIIAGFQGVQGPTQDNFYKKGKDATFLVGTISLIGTGYTLTRASRVILIEPAWMSRDEMQAYSRVIRVGQEAETVYTYRFYMGRDSVEGKIMARQENRGDLNAPLLADPDDRADLAQAPDRGGFEEEEYQQPRSFPGGRNEDKDLYSTAYAHGEDLKPYPSSSSVQYHNHNFYGGDDDEGMEI